MEEWAPWEVVARCKRALEGVFQHRINIFHTNRLLPLIWEECMAAISKNILRNGDREAEWEVGWEEEWAEEWVEEWAEEWEEGWEEISVD